MEANGFPTPGMPQWDAAARSVVEGLRASTRQTDDRWAVLGAFYVASDLLGADTTPAYGELIDAALLAARDLGVPSSRLPPFLLQRRQDLPG
jgi:hypothetical protein